MMLRSVRPLTSSILRRRVACTLEQQSTTRFCQSHYFSTLLTGDERSQAIAELQGTNTLASWEEISDRNAIKKTYFFNDFNEAWGFMTRVALLAEKEDHHPEWFNVYNTVEVTLSTHDCGGVSEKDIKMAKLMDVYAESILPTRK